MVITENRAMNKIAKFQIEPDSGLHLDFDDQIGSGISIPKGGEHILIDLPEIHGAVLLAQECDSFVFSVTNNNKVALSLKYSGSRKLLLGSIELNKLFIAMQWARMANAIIDNHFRPKRELVSREQYIHVLKQQLRNEGIGLRRSVWYSIDDFLFTPNRANIKLNELIHGMGNYYEGALRNVSIKTVGQLAKKDPYRLASSLRKKADEGDLSVHNPGYIRVLKWIYQARSVEIIKSTVYSFYGQKARDLQSSDKKLEISTALKSEDIPYSLFLFITAAEGLNSEDFTMKITRESKPSAEWNHIVERVEDYCTR